MLLFSVGSPEKDRIQVTSLNSPANPETEGYDWISALVEIESVGLKGIVKIQMCLSDIISFKEQLLPLYKNLSGTAEFRTIEGQLYILIDVDKLGHIKATGYLLADFNTDNKLNFDLRYDQTLLWHTIAEIDEALFELSGG